jgi:di/tricarboxylate transporter
MRCSFARRRSLAIGLAALGASVFLPPLFAELSLRGQRSIIVTVAVVVLWTSAALDSGTTALLAIALLALTGAAVSVRDALQGFLNPVPYFLVSVLAMGLAVARSGLAERIARRILTHARGSSLRVYVQLVLAMPLLTFLLPSATTRSSILVHIYEEVFTLARVPPDAPVLKAVMLALSSINRLASTALLTRAMPAAALERATAWTGREVRTLAIVLGASVLWLTDGVHHLDPALPALLALVAQAHAGRGPARVERSRPWRRLGQLFRDRRLDLPRAYPR